MKVLNVSPEYRPDFRNPVEYHRPDGAPVGKGRPARTVATFAEWREAASWAVHGCDVNRLAGRAEG